MCGITGILGKEIKNKESLIGMMTQEIYHRGPDQDGFFVDEYVGLGMRRLSIIDLKTGKQPIESEDGSLLIFFNGEIYNYKELKDDLLLKGAVFKTETDTEVILKIYEIYGSGGVSKLRGMFVFCIYDKNLKTIFIARDFFGIKPLYYLKKDNKILGFASEIKSLLLHPEYKKEVNNDAVFNYLRFQYNPLTETFFKNIYKLPPAHFIKINLFNSTFEIEKYWEFEMASTEISLDDAKDKILEILRDSVKHHIISDVPVGSFLSGGVDSSIIAVLMKEIWDKENVGKNIKYKNKTFTVGFDKISEENEARQTSNLLETDHTEITIGPEEYFKELPKAVWHFDEPVADPSAIGLYFLAREARKKVTVILSGEGADELFGGYNIYLAPIARRKLAWIPHFILSSIVKVFDLLNLNFWGTNYIRRLNMNLEDWYIGNASIFKKDEIEKIWKSGDQVKNEFLSLSPLYEIYKKRGYSDSVMMQMIDINTWLPGDILAKADKMTMAHSIELRVPFLDIAVANLAKKLPQELKWNDGVTKYVLREAFKSLVPEETRNRKKLGFPTPIKHWFDKDRKFVYETILSNIYIKEHFNIKEVEMLIEDHLEEKLDNSRKIYILYMLSLWYNVFIKNQ